jgi:hypothetical protein
MKQMITLSAILLTSSAFAAENNLNNIANNINAKQLKAAAANVAASNQQMMQATPNNVPGQDQVEQEKLKQQQKMQQQYSNQPQQNVQKQATSNNANSKAQP